MEEPCILIMPPHHVQSLITRVVVRAWQPAHLDDASSPFPVTAPKPKAARSSTRRRNPLSDLNSRDASAAQQKMLLPPRPPEKQKRELARLQDLISRPGARRPDRLPFPDQELRTCMERRTGQEARRRGMEPIDQFEARTLEKKAVSGATLSSGATPPVYASISPEVAAACGSAMSACFVAGHHIRHGHHVLPGVSDRRKCRSRGILAITGEGLTSEDLNTEPYRASIHWLSSPSGAEAGTCSTKCSNEEASVNWLVMRSSCRGAPRTQRTHFGGFSPDCMGLLGSPLLGGLLDFGTPASDMSGTTLSSGFLPVKKTPSSGDSISPFSLIVKRASESSARLRSFVSSDTRSGLARTGSRPMKMMDPVLECLEMMSLSPRPGDDDFDGNSALPAPLPELSFQFVGALMPLESIDFSSFKRSPRDIELKGKETSFWKSVMAETRISWREGLGSRMFDIDDLDCCKWISDDEDSPVLLHNNDALPDACGFGSIEFSCIGDELDNDSSMPSTNLVLVVESMRAEGF
uniref:Uncharacterized protein n=1 Tax=Setaria italica TaxID=4555 RepID=K3Z0A6_SETIT